MSESDVSSRRFAAILRNFTGALGEGAGVTAHRRPGRMQKLPAIHNVDSRYLALLTTAGCDVHTLPSAVVSQLR